MKSLPVFALVRAKTEDEERHRRNSSKPKGCISCRVAFTVIVSCRNTPCFSYGDIRQALLQYGLGQLLPCKAKQGKCFLSFESAV